MKQVSENIWLLAKSANHLILGRAVPGAGCQIFWDYMYNVKCPNSWLPSTLFVGISLLHYPDMAVDGSLVSELPTALFFDYSFISMLDRNFFNSGLFLSVNLSV